MQKIKDIIKIIIGIEVIALLVVLGRIMVQEAELRDMEITQWIEIASYEDND
jgi:hypothetical protein